MHIIYYYILCQGKGVPKKGVPAIAEIDQQLGNYDSPGDCPTVDQLQRLLEPSALGPPYPGSDQWKLIALAQLIAAQPELLLC